MRAPRAHQPIARSSLLVYFLLYIFIFEQIEEVYAGRDYYDVLGVARDADAATIKKAFRKLAVKYHPGMFPCCAPRKSVAH